jgi:hypothetical protein
LRACYDCHHKDGAKKQYAFAVCHWPTVRAKI